MKASKPSNVTSLRPAPKGSDIRYAPCGHDEIRLKNDQQVTIALDTASAIYLKEQHIPALDTLIDELKLWHSVLGGNRLPLKRLEIVRPGLGLAPHEITRIVHCLASLLEVLPINQREHRAVCTPEDINSTHLALLKGLGFNQCQLLIDHEEDLNDEAFTHSFLAIKQYGFAKCGLQITHSGCMAALTPNIRKALKEHQPDYIYIGNDSHHLSIEGIEDGAGTILDESDTLIDNIICLGPDAVSTINRRDYENWHSVNRYSEAIAQNQLPFSRIQEP